GRRSADRPARVLAERSRAEACGGRDSRAARPARGRSPGIPRIARLAVRENVRSPPAELVKIFLADKKAPGGFERCADGRVPVCDIAGIDPRPQRRPHALRTDLVLDAERHPMQRTAIVAGLDLALSPPSRQ